VNLQLSLRKPTQARIDLYGFRVSYQQIANYCKAAAVCIKPFVDHYDYKPGTHCVADETYIKVRGVKVFIWFIIDSANLSSLDTGLLPTEVSDRVSWQCGWPQTV
jgi:transposase-like protein